MQRLHPSMLSDLPPRVGRPTYDRERLRIGIVHLGLGAFHRAHQAVMTETLLRAGHGDWGIAGVSLRSSETRDALAPQDGLYTLAIRDADQDRFEVIGAVVRTLVASEDPAALLALMAAPETRIVSLTVTEKGYCHRPATGDLDDTHPDIIHDLAHPSRPRTAIGFITEAIDRRRRMGLAPFTVLSCDNLPANGRTLAQVVTCFAAHRDQALADYIKAHVAFPSSMVDRIVPATTSADRDLIARALHVDDAWPVVTEPFVQWVIEDRFPAGRPDWEVAGATFVTDVAPFEHMKLRLLNGSHSTLAYLGCLAGHETVSQAMAAPGFADLIEGLMREEVTPTLPVLDGFDIAAYRSALLARFRNPMLRHRTQQIAMDGSQKLPQRLLGTIRDRLRAGARFERLALGLAAWMIYATGRDEAGHPIDVRDPLASRIAAATRGTRDPAALVEAYMGFGDVFGTDLPASAPFRGEVTQAAHHLLQRGAAQVVRGFSTARTLSVTASAYRD